MLDNFVEWGYLGLFLSSFLAATILPFSSEAVFAALLALGLAPLKCLIIATTGNWLGGMTNYCLGRLGKIEWIEKYLKIKKEKIHTIQNKLKGKGASMAFFSFLPVVGDIIAVALGYMEANIYIVNITMFLGKMFRYILLMYGVEWLKG